MTRHTRLTGYSIVYIDAPDHPEIERYLYTRRRVIYINLAASEGANIVRLVIR